MSSSIDRDGSASNMQYFGSLTRRIGSPRNTKFMMSPYSLVDGNLGIPTQLGAGVPSLAKSRSFQPVNSRQQHGGHGFNTCRFTLVTDLIEQQIKQVKLSKRITIDDVSQGHDVFDQVKCKQCGCLPKDEPIECANCETIFCEICHASNMKKNDDQLVNKCPICDEKLIKKSLNRKVKEIMLGALRFKCDCRKGKPAFDSPDQQFDHVGGGSVSDTTIATESILNDVLKFAGNLTNYSSSFSKNISPTSPRHNLQRVDDSDDRRAHQEILSDGFNMHDSRVKKDKELSSEDFKTSNSNNHLRKREQKYIEKTSSGNCLTQTKNIEGNNLTQIEYTHSEFIQHVEKDCVLRKQYHCPNTRCIRDCFHSIEQLRGHLLHECIYTIFECKVCSEHAPYHKLKNQHTKDDCLLNLRRENQQIKREKVELQKQLQAMQKSSSKKKIPQDILVEALLHYRRQERSSTSSGSNQ